MDPLQAWLVQSLGLTRRLLQRQEAWRRLWERAWNAAHKRVISFNSCGLAANLVNVVRTMGGTWIDPWCSEMPRYGKVELCWDEDLVIREAARLVRWCQVKRRNFPDFEDGIDTYTSGQLSRSNVHTPWEQRTLNPCSLTLCGGVPSFTEQVRLSRPCVLLVVRSQRRWNTLFLSVSARNTKPFEQKLCVLTAQVSTFAHAEDHRPRSVDDRIGYERATPPRVQPPCKYLSSCVG